uniref:Uncharacterized protein n=1 Tax=Cacopsylla melanoneura TaxID=428564 RepID=A0A8D8Y2Q8_9HEMI
MSTLPRDRENRLPFCLDSHVEKRYRVSGIFSRILKKLFFFCAEKILFSGEKFLPKIVFSSRKEWFFFLCMMCVFFTLEDLCIVQYFANFKSPSGLVLREV